VRRPCGRARALQDSYQNCNRVNGRLSAETPERSAQVDRREDLGRRKFAPLANYRTAFASSGRVLRGTLRRVAATVTNGRVAFRRRVRQRAHDRVRARSPAHRSRYRARGRGDIQLHVGFEPGRVVRADYLPGSGTNESIVPDANGQLSEALCQGVDEPFLVRARV